MKNLLFMALLLTTLSGFAQCDRDVTMTSSLTEYLDSTGVLQRWVNEKSIIEVGKTQIRITPDGNDTMTGKITSAICNWTTPYKTGKGVIKADFTNHDGTTYHSTITLEGKEGKLLLTIVVAEMENRQIRVSIDSFKENN